MSEITEVTVGFLAGVFDAIGHVTTRTVPGGTVLAQVSISSVNMPLLRYVAKHTGVSIVTVRRDYARLGCSEHCIEAHLHVESVTGRWQLVGARAVLFLTTVLPYLVLRADDVITVLAQCSDAPVKPATLNKMHALGWGAA
jgi:hypothetical protein